MIYNFEDRKHFGSICNFISNNYWDLRNEFEKIFELLSIAEKFGLSYTQKKMTEAHFKSVTKKSEYSILGLLLNEMRNFSKEAEEEFIQKVDIINIYDTLLEEIRADNILGFIWKTRTILQYILYSLERIYIAQEMDKKIAIFKGMIAYC